MPKNEDESRWKKRPPVSGMSIEEMRKRVEDGIANRRRTGELPSAGLRILKTRASGPILTKKHRRVLIAATNLAIYALANNDREDYCESADVINAVRHQCKMPSTFMKAMLEGVAEQAAELAGEPFEVLDQLARAWLAEHFTPSGKLISITKGNTDGTTKGQAHNQSEAAPGRIQES